MSEAVKVALIAAGASAISSFAGVVASGSLTRYRIKCLEKKVNKHNQVIERVYKLEQKTDDQGRDLEDIKDVVYKE